MIYRTHSMPGLRLYRKYTLLLVSSTNRGQSEKQKEAFNDVSRSYVIILTFNKSVFVCLKASFLFYIHFLSIRAFQQSVHEACLQIRKRLVHRMHYFTFV